MDFGNPLVLFSGMLIGMIGLGMFIYGKKQQEPKPLAAGAILCLYPYFVASLLVTWLGFAIVIAGLYAWTRAD